MAKTELPGRFDKLDKRIAGWMERYGHFAHRISLAVLFTWLGTLKLVGHDTVTSLLAMTIYWGDPATMVRVLGGWELLIGLTLAWKPTIRISLLLLAIRLPGTALALVLQYDVAFAESVLVPTPAGQYLIKDLLLFSAAMVIGGTVRHERSDVLH